VVGDRKAARRAAAWQLDLSSGTGLAEALRQTDAVNAMSASQYNRWP
jgi:hypothetical protein